MEPAPQLTVQQLEKALADARKQESVNKIESELANLNKEYGGKCFATHTFTERSRASYKHAIYYERFFIKDGNIFAATMTLSLSSYDSHYKASSTNINYSRSADTRQLTGQNDYNASYNLDHGSWRGKKQISLDTFMTIWNAGRAVSQMLKDVFNGKTNDIPLIEE